MPTIEQFIAKVAEMRSRQKLYYQNRQGVDLAESKRLEKQVDTMLIQLLKSAPGQDEIAQLSLQI